jgi:ABC-2 type transport system ATP-binding protein
VARLVALSNADPTTSLLQETATVPPSEHDPMVLVDGLRKSFGAHTALDGMSLRIPRGQVFGLLGPNGAGKSTLVRVLSTLLTPDSGTVLINGIDVRAAPALVRRQIGLAGQAAAVDDLLTGMENLRLIGRLQGLRRTDANTRATRLLARFRLDDVADRLVGGYSGGMRRRLDLAGALVGGPRLVVLDEPTTGLDPQSRLDMWDMVTELASDGTTVLLTTQYLEEADQLADDIAVIDRGRVVARGTSDELKQAAGGDLVSLVVRDRGDLPAACAVVAAVGTAAPATTVRTRRIEVAVAGGNSSLASIIDRLAELGIETCEIGLRRPSLDDVFLRLTAEGQVS